MQTVDKEGTIETKIYRQTPKGPIRSLCMFYLKLLPAKILLLNQLSLTGAHLENENNFTATLGTEQTVSLGEFLDKRSRVREVEKPLCVHYIFFSNEMNSR